MEPTRPILIKTLKGVVKAIDNTLVNLRDQDATTDPITDETYPDIQELEASQLKLEILIIKLEINESKEELERLEK